MHPCSTLCLSELSPKSNALRHFLSRFRFYRKGIYLQLGKVRATQRQTRDVLGSMELAAPSSRLELDTNLTLLTKSLRAGSYGPSRLRAVFIPKPNSTKERLICIPIIRDRIVQRAIANYLIQNEKLPIENEFSYGFIKGRGTKQAILRAIELRSKYAWCLKTDIEAFFDRIPRADVKSRVAKALPNSSVTPLLFKVIDCEIKETWSLKPKLTKQGILPGIGLRQGMPLSPLLANLVLSGFDASIRKAGIEMIRYADDLLLFFEF